MKPWYRSKTIWLNVSAAVAGAVQFLPGLKTELDPTVYAYAFFVLSVVNLVLRKVTTEGISGRAQ